MTIYCKLVASVRDVGGYITYVFQNMDKSYSPDTKYLMCIRYPNWNNCPIKLGDIGYLNFIEVKAGIDKWYDGENFIPYKYDAIQFLKFIPEPDSLDANYIM